MKEWTEESARLHLAGLCARSEQCTYDLRKKLRLWGLRDAEADRIMDYLEQNRFVDDARYAGAFARTKGNHGGWGRLKIRAALRAKQVCDADIRDALDTIDSEAYTSKLEALYIAKARSLDLTSPKERAKLFRSLMQRGYTASEISAVERDLRE